MIIKNEYHDLAKICESCGFPVMNGISLRRPSKYCREVGQLNNDRINMSNCQKAGDRMKYKLRLRPRPKKPIENVKLPLIKTDIRIRLCMGRLCMDKNDRSFESKGKFNRLCPSCSASQEIIVKTGKLPKGSLNSKRD